MYIIKLGGSVITDKGIEESFRKETMEQLATEIQQAQKPLILVHGAGSYGHILAKKYDLNRGYKNKKQLQGFALTHGKVNELNLLVLSALHKKEIPAVSLPPHVFIRLDNHRLLTIDYTHFNDYLQQGFTPVTYGDVVLDKTLKFSICSGDLLTQVLAAQFKPEKVIFVIDEDGLYTSNPKMDLKASFIKSATIEDLDGLVTTANHHADVTEGMSGKINTIQLIAQTGIDTVLVNGNKPQRLYDTLVGRETICTLVKGKKP